jgi:chemotaxis protein MotB
MSVDTQDCPECPSGAPAWVMTFADLMSLLMCFFVLLLAFSEMDLLKFKQVAGSMSQAFGVQKKIKASEIPKGTSVVAKEFSPGKPTPTVLNVVEQMTVDDSKKNLEFNDSESRVDGSKEMVNEVGKQAKKLNEELLKEVRGGLLEIVTFNDQVVVRIRERGSFPSGSSRIHGSFVPVLNKISAALKKVDGHIIVAGHTDNVPIATSQFPSNWVLSAARAATVVHYMTKNGGVQPDRLQIRAHADMLPLVPNDTRTNRAKNRRVEIIVANEEHRRKVNEQAQAAADQGAS